MNILILKDSYNTFEKYYIDKLNQTGFKTEFYYKSSSVLRKLFTHYALPFESIWYGCWKKNLNMFDMIIVFDSLHSSNLLKYIRRRFSGRLIYWHWNPINKDKEKKIWAETKSICEHWTFNSIDAKKYEMGLNNQFFFFQNKTMEKKEDNVFFVGADKGRYSKLMEYKQIIEKKGLLPDFHVVCKDLIKYEDTSICQTDFMEYDEVIKRIQKSKAIIEINQAGQTGLTARALEAMFLGTKLITNNQQIINYAFYDKNNVFIDGVDDFESLDSFLKSDFKKIEEEKLYPYSSEGWVEHFVHGV